MTKETAYPYVNATGVRDVVVNVVVVAQAHDDKAHQGSHVQGEDGDEKGLHTRQVTMHQDGHKHNLPQRGGGHSQKHSVRTTSHSQLIRAGHTAKST